MRRTAIACLVVAASAAFAPPAAAWGPAAPAQKNVSEVAVDDRGFGVAEVGGRPALVARNGSIGAPGDVPAGDVDIAVAPTGRVAVAVVEDRQTVRLGVGTTRALPTSYEPFVTGESIDSMEVAVGDDGRILVAYENGFNGIRAARRAPGADEPSIETLRSPDTAGFRIAAGVRDAAITNAGRPIVYWSVSAVGTSGGTVFQAASSPDGPFNRSYGNGLGYTSYTRDAEFALERTGFVSAFYLEDRETGRALRLRRASPEGETRVATVKRPGAWAAGVGANGAAAVAWIAGRRLSVRRRTMQGRWEPRTRLWRAGGPLAAAVDARARITVAFTRGGSLHASSQRPGGDFTEPVAIRGSAGCRAGGIAGAPSGRAMLLLRCEDGLRLAPN